MYLALVMLHHVGDMVLHNSEGLLARPVFIVGLAAVTRYPRRRLLVPYEAVATHRHLLISGESDDLLSVAGKAKSTILAPVGLRLHIVLGHEHIKLETDGLSFRQARVGQIVLIDGDSGANTLAELLGVVFQRFLVGHFVDTLVIVEGAHG